MNPMPAAKHKPNQTLKGATVNRELECLKCVLDLATQRKYIPENAAALQKKRPSGRI